MTRSRHSVRSVGRPRGPETELVALRVLPITRERLDRLRGPLSRSQYADLAIEALGDRMDQIDSTERDDALRMLAELIEHHRRAGTAPRR